MEYRHHTNARNLCFSDINCQHQKAVDQIARWMLESDRPILIESEPGSGAILLAKRAATLTTGITRAPHHTVSERGMTGEIELARTGVLILNDVLNFRPLVIGRVAQDAHRSGVRVVMIHHPEESKLYERQLARIMELFEIKPEGDEPWIYVRSLSYKEMKENPRQCTTTRALRNRHGFA